MGGLPIPWILRQSLICLHDSFLKYKILIQDIVSRSSCLIVFVFIFWNNNISVPQALNLQSPHQSGDAC